MNEINKNFENNSETTLKYEFANSLNGNNLVQRLKTNQVTKESEMDEEFAIEKLNLYLMSKQYKEAIKFIDKKAKGIDDHLYNYLLFDIKIKSFNKIIKNKLSTYKYKNKTIIYSPDMKISIILEKMFQKMIIYFKEIIEILYMEDCNEPLKEKLLQNYCEGLYLLAKFHKIKNQPQDAISYLSISHSMLKTYIDKCKDPNTYHIYQKIIILLISLLIEDYSFYTAVEFNILCLKLCIKELFIRNKTEKGINMNNLPYIIKKNYKDVFQNINLSLFFMGICYENLGQLKNALDAYKQASWFITKFYDESNSKFIEVIQGTEIIASKYNDFILEKIKNRDSELEKMEKERIKRQLDYERLRQLNKISSGIIYDLEKYPKISNFLENEIQLNKSVQPVTISSHFFDPLNRLEKSRENNKSHSTIKMLDTFVLYNDLLSKDYQKYINNIRGLNFNKFDKDSLEKLDKYNQNLILDKNIILEKKKKNLKTQFEQNLASKINKYIKKDNSEHKKLFNNNNNSEELYFFKRKQSLFDGIDRLDKSSSNSTLAISSRTININKFPNKIKIKNKEKSKSIIYLRNDKTKNNIIFKSYYPNKIKRYPLTNSFVFNNSFKKKVDFLEKMDNREIKFQKDLLYLKKVESRILKDVEKENDCTVKGIKEANFSFNLIKEKVYEKYKNSKLLFDSSPSYKIDMIDKINIEKNKIQQSIINGLNAKNLNKLKSLDKKIVVKRNEQFNKLIHYNYSGNFKKVDNIIFEKNIQNINNVNNSFLSSLDKDLINYQKKEEFLFNSKNNIK